MTSLSVTLYSMITITLIGFSTSTPEAMQNVCVPIDSWVSTHASLKTIREIWICVVSRISCNNRLAAIFLTNNTKCSVRVEIRTPAFVVGSEVESLHSIPQIYGPSLAVIVEDLLNVAVIFAPLTL